MHSHLARPPALRPARSRPLARGLSASWDFANPTALGEATGLLRGTTTGASAGSGPGGRATTYSGSTSSYSRVTLAGHPQLAPATISLALRVRFDAAPASTNLVVCGRGFDGSAASYLVGCLSDWSYQLAFAFYAGGWRYATLGTTPTAGVWYDLLATFDGATVALYERGMPAGSSSYSGSIPTTTSDLYFGLVTWPGGTPAFEVACTVEGAHLWGRALSAAEARTLAADFYAPVRPTRGVTTLGATSGGGGGGSSEMRRTLFRRSGSRGVA
jgi:hypothetical protein